MKTTVCGKEIEYGLDEDSGQFKSTWNGEKFESLTLKGLKDQLTRQLKKNPLAVPIIKVETDHRDDKQNFIKGVVVGVHSGNRNLLVRWDGYGHADQERPFRREFLKANSDLKKLRQLYAGVKKAQKAYYEFLEANEFDHNKVIEDHFKDEA